MSDPNLDYHEHSVKVYWYVGLCGPFLSLVPLFMIRQTRKKLNEMYEKKKVSVNIINVWMYKFILISLSIQTFISCYSTIVILYT